MYSIMITGKVIQEVYKKYRKCPSTLERVEFSLLEGRVSEVHKIQIQDNRLIIGSIEEKSPFHSLPLNKIHGIVNFEKCVKKHKKCTLWAEFQRIILCFLQKSVNVSALGRESKSFSSRVFTKIRQNIYNFKY